MNSPITIVTRPERIPTETDVCTASSTLAAFPSPIDQATMTLLPTARPAKILIIIPTMAAVVPIAPIAPSTFERPTMIISAAL